MTRGMGGNKQPLSLSLSYLPSPLRNPSLKPCVEAEFDLQAALQSHHDVFSPFWGLRQMQWVAPQHLLAVTTAPPPLRGDTLLAITLPQGDSQSSTALSVASLSCPAPVSRLCVFDERLPGIAQPVVALALLCDGSLWEVTIDPSGVPALSPSTLPTDLSAAAKVCSII